MTTLPEFQSSHGCEFFYQRHQMIETREDIDWAVGETLAFATLII
jgi:2-oxoglutarate dehydrogenase complex dehydrogenase (E1) component-like enzyme